MTAAGSHPVPNSPVGPGGEASMGYEQIMQLLHGLQSTPTAQAAGLYLDLAGQLDSQAAALRSSAAIAAQNWTGSAAQAAMDQYQVNHDQTAQLAAQARTAGNTLNWLSGVMTQYQNLPSPQVATGFAGIVADVSQGIASGQGGIAAAANGGPGKAKADAAAQAYLRTFNQHLATANSHMPKNLAAPPGQNHAGAEHFTSPSGNQQGFAGGAGASPNYSSMTGSNGSGSTGHIPNYTSSPAPSFTPSSNARQFNPAKLPSGSAGPNAALQGFTPPSGTAGGSPFGTGTPAAIPSSRSGLGGGGPYASPPTPFGGSFSKNPLGPAENVKPLNNDVVPPQENLSPGSAASTAAGEARAGATGAEGASGMPMGGMGGGGGEQDQERQRQAWKNQDPDIWGMPEGTTGSIIE